MKLTAKGYYSIKALLDLTIVASDYPVAVRTIAERQQIPAPYLEKVLIELRQAGLVRSQRGAQGGYQLARLPRRIRLVDILKAVGEDWEPPSFFMADPLAEDWVTQAVWQRISHQIQRVLQETTLEDLYFDARSWQASQNQDSLFMI
jgi:Rrf2 family protein